VISQRRARVLAASVGHCFRRASGKASRRRHAASCRRQGAAVAPSGAAGAGTAEYTAALLADGFARFDGAGIPSSTVEAAHAYACAELDRARWSPRYHWSRLVNNVNAPRNRHSVPLRDGRPARALLRAVCGGDARRAETFEALVGRSGRLVELSAIVSLPGAGRQHTHSDIPHAAGVARVAGSGSTAGLPRLASCFTALHEVRSDMGPTCILPGSHSAAFHEADRGQATAFADALAVLRRHAGVEEVTAVAATAAAAPDERQREEDAVEAAGEVLLADGSLGPAAPPPPRSAAPREVPPELLELVWEGVGAGGASYLMDARCAHWGGANSSAVPRVVLCFAFQRADDEDIDGFTYHLDPSCRGKFTLGDFLPPHL
jgi:hypothetical protein